MPQSTCNYCGVSDQTIEHLFVDCPIIVALWERLEAFRKSSTLINVNELSFTTTTILLNMVHARPKYLANLLVLITKQYVYACKCLNTQPTTFEVISKIETIFQYERYDAWCVGNVCKACCMIQCYKNVLLLWAKKQTCFSGLLSSIQTMPSHLPPYGKEGIFSLWWQNTSWRSCPVILLTIFMRKYHCCDCCTHK